MNSCGGELATVPQRHDLSICLVSHLAFGTLSRTGGHIGGVEHQTAQLARWLALRGHRVSMITWDEGQQDGVNIDGVTVHKVCRRNAGLPGLRFIYPRWSSLVAALRRADADVYYHNSAEYVTGQIALWCARHGRRFVFSSASNADCDKDLPFLRARRERVLYRIGLRRATARIVQTRAQQKMMQESFGVSSIVIPMPATDASARFPRAAGTLGTAPGPVLWVGRICRVKRPDRLVTIARACPHIQFELIGPTDGSAYADGIVQSARSVANITIRGSLDRDEVAATFARASCLCCTSEIEGFPNTFLEAWSQSVPVISMVDPDGIIEHHGCGWFEPDLPAMVERLTQVFADQELLRTAGSTARRYYADTHTPEAVMPRFEALFMSVAGATPGVGT